MIDIDGWLESAYEDRTYLPDDECDECDEYDEGDEGDEDDDHDSL